MCKPSGSTVDRGSVQLVHQVVWYESTKTRKHEHTGSTRAEKCAQLLVVRLSRQATRPRIQLTQHHPTPRSSPVTVPNLDCCLSTLARPHIVIFRLNIYYSESLHLLLVYLISLSLVRLSHHHLPPYISYVFNIFLDPHI